MALPLETHLGTYPQTAAIKDGTIGSPRIAFSFSSLTPPRMGFPPMVNDLAFEFSELAIVTFLVAYLAGKPLVLLPVTILSRLQHQSIVKRAGSAIREPRDLNGKRVGLRAFTVTTAMWVRGFLMNDYGVDDASITWVATEGAHLDTYVDPPNVIRKDGANLKAMLLAGEIDAWIGDPEIVVDPGLVLLIPDAAEAEWEWFARTRTLPVNHVAAIRRDVLDSHPWLGRELLDVFGRASDAYLEGIRAHGPRTADERFRARLIELGADPFPLGYAALRGPIELASRYAVAEGIIARPVSMDELIDERIG